MLYQLSYGRVYFSLGNKNPRKVLAFRGFSIYLLYPVMEGLIALLIDASLNATRPAVSRTKLQYPKIGLTKRNKLRLLADNIYQFYPHK